MPEPAPGRIVRQDGRDLREPEDEDEVEEELEWCDRVLAFGAVLAHGSKLTPRAAQPEPQRGFEAAAATGRSLDFGVPSA